MNDRPNGAELLAIARETLLKEFVPLLPEERRYDALMVANAMAIARREIEAGDAPLRQEFTAVAALYGEDVRPPPDRDGLTAELRRLSRRLARDIREGRFDGDEGRRAALLKFLREATERKLRLSNPKYLAASGDQGR